MAAIFDFKINVFQQHRLLVVCILVSANPYNLIVANLVPELHDQKN